MSHDSNKSFLALLLKLGLSFLRVNIVPETHSITAWSKPISGILTFKEVMTRYGKHKIAGRKSPTDLLPVELQSPISHVVTAQAGKDTDGNWDDVTFAINIQG